MKQALPVTLNQVIAIMPRSGKVAAAYLGPLNAAMLEFGIDRKRRVEMFLATLAVECGQLTAMQENLNYSAEGLANTWPTRFAEKDASGSYLTAPATPGIAAQRSKVPNQLAKNLARQPEAIANTVYANRMGNGDVKSGHGWLYRGAGLIALTGRDNQARCATHFGIAPEKVGDWLRTPEGACRSAAWFWKKNGCNEHADKGDFDAVSDAVNLGHQTARQGDAIGYAERLEFLKVAERVV